MQLLVATMIAATLIVQGPEADMDAFIRFMWASERCPGVNINYEKTLEQVIDLGGVLNWDSDRINYKIEGDLRVAAFQYQQDSTAFCDSVRDQFRAYDPAYLRQVGVVD